jgi:glutaminyl-peptide cyclotransferase
VVALFRAIRPGGGAGAVLLATLACAQAQTSPPPRFDASRAYEHVRQLVAIGPRVAGSAGAQQAREYVTKEIAALGLQVREQTFDAATPFGPVRMVNLRVSIAGDATTPETGQLVIAGHYDTKLFRGFRFVGANDGGSSTAFLIEIARALKDRRNPIPLELLFLDGEEAVVEWQGDDHTYGSRYYVDEARKNGTLHQIRAMILVDMIGDRDLRILRESNSTPWLTEIILAAARRTNHPEFANEELAVEDDHIPFLRAGIPAVDIIDLDYPAWHTDADTLDKVSARSLQVVGDILLAALPEIETRLLTR